MKGKSFLSSVFLLTIWFIAGSGLLLERHVCHKKGEQSLRIAMHTHHSCDIAKEGCCASEGEEVVKNVCCEHYQYLLLGEEGPVSSSPAPLHVFFQAWTLPVFSSETQRLLLAKSLKSGHFDRPPPELLQPSLPLLSVFRI